MKTNKTNHPARKINAHRRTPAPITPDWHRAGPTRQSDFLALCFYPGMKTATPALQEYPTAV